METDQSDGQTDAPADDSDSPHTITAEVRTQQCCCIEQLERTARRMRELLDYDADDDDGWWISPDLVTLVTDEARGRRHE